MARTTRSRSKRSAGVRRFWLYLLSLIALVAIVYTAWLWWDMRSWRPDEAQFPDQGAVIASSSNTVRFETLRAVGGRFVYLELGGVGQGPDAGFAARYDAARAAQLQVGMIHLFDPCVRADPQSSRFTRMVPRTAELLPPAIALSKTTESCDQKVSDAAVESELMTLINQIELHAGKPAILKLSEEFESRHRVANTIDRDLWLERDRARPAYAGRPWLLWSANRHLVTEASEDPIEWVVIQK